MEKTGVVRRIDELGRIVIPMEFRRCLRIKSGESLDISSDGVNSIYLKKNDNIESMANIALNLAETINATLKKSAIVTDTKKVLAVSGSFSKELEDKKIEASLEEKIMKGNMQMVTRDELLNITKSNAFRAITIIKPIVVDDEIIGSLIVFSETEFTEAEKFLLDNASVFLSQFM